MPFNISFLVLKRRSETWVQYSISHCRNLFINSAFRLRSLISRLIFGVIGPCSIPRNLSAPLKDRSCIFWMKSIESPDSPHPNHLNRLSGNIKKLGVFSVWKGHKPTCRVPRCFSSTPTPSTTPTRSMLPFCMGVIRL